MPERGLVEAPGPPVLPVRNPRDWQVPYGISVPSSPEKEFDPRRKPARFRIEKIRSGKINDPAQKQSVAGQ